MKTEAFLHHAAGRFARRCVGWAMDDTLAINGWRKPVSFRAEAKAVIFEWIEVFYKREQLHNALGFKSPVDFESKL